MSSTKGLEKLFMIIKRDLKSREDCAVAALHLMLTNHALSCVGLGEKFSDEDMDIETELLPENWNECQELYCLRYISPGKKGKKHQYLLKIVKSGGKLHVNLIVDEEKHSQMTVNVADYVSEDYTSFAKTYNNLDTLSNAFKEKVISPLQDKSKGGKTSSPGKEKLNETPSNKSTTGTAPTSSPSFNPNPVNDPIPTRAPNLGRQGGVSPMAPMVPMIGGEDLDPLGRSFGGGGMLFDPVFGGGMGRPNSGGGRIGPFGGGGSLGMPPHMVPPGARFDPFSPITPGRYNPDPDHFRPPDYDDMFM